MEDPHAYGYAQGAPSEVKDAFAPFIVIRPRHCADWSRQDEICLGPVAVHIVTDQKGEYAAMIDPKLTMEVPTHVREFAVKSVDQAEKAISTFMESASKSFAKVPAPMSDVAKQALAITEANIKASFEHARKLMEAKDIGEVLRLQTEFVRSQFGTATEQFKQMTGGAASSDEKEKPDLI